MFQVTQRLFLHRDLLESVAFKPRSLKMHHLSDNMWPAMPACHIWRTQSAMLKKVTHQSVAVVKKWASHRDGSSTFPKPESQLLNSCYLNLCTSALSCRCICPECSPPKVKVTPKQQSRFLKASQASKCYPGATCVVVNVKFPMQALLSIPQLGNYDTACSCQPIEIKMRAEAYGPLPSSCDPDVSSRPTHDVTCTKELT